MFKFIWGAGMLILCIATIIGLTDASGTPDYAPGILLLIFLFGTISICLIYDRTKQSSPPSITEEQPLANRKTTGDVIIPTQQDTIDLVQTLAKLNTVANRTGRPEDQSLAIIHSALTVACHRKDSQAVALLLHIWEPYGLIGRAYAIDEGRQSPPYTFKTLTADAFATGYGIVLIANHYENSLEPNSHENPIENHKAFDALIDQVTALRKNHNTLLTDCIDYDRALSTYLSALRDYTADLHYLTRLQVQRLNGITLDSSDTARAKRVYANLSNRREICSITGDHLTVLFRNS